MLLGALIEQLLLLGGVLTVTMQSPLELLLRVFQHVVCRGPGHMRE